MVSSELLNAAGKLALAHVGVQPSPEIGDRIKWSDRNGGIWWSAGTVNSDSRERCTPCDESTRDRVVYRHAGTQVVVCQTCVETRS